MLASWRVTEEEVRTLQEPGGRRFTQFVDALIHATCLASGMPPASLRTNERTNIADGGIDTVVTAPIPSDPEGYFKYPTCWQYKGGSYSTITDSDLKDEVNKPYASQLIKDGHAYRLAVCDGIPAARQETMEKVLARECSLLNPSCPPPLVVPAGRLATWASRFPALVVRFFRPSLQQALHLATWGRNARAVTSTFVPVTAWLPVSVSIANHVQLESVPSEVCLPLQGEAGVGKTRLVYESLVAVEGMENFVLYTNDEATALVMAQLLVNNEDMSFVLVADECTLPTRLKLIETMQGHRARVRLIAIDNSGEKPATGAPEFWLLRMQREAVDEVLRQNFPNVPDERRRAYADISEGFIRFAAALCTRDHMLTDYDLGPVVGHVRDLIRRIVPDDERLQVLEALSMVTRIGFAGDLEDDLNSLCALLGLDLQRTRQALARLQDSPGFVTRAGRFYYVTPEIACRALLEGAWRRWVEADPEGFLRNLPARLLERFQRRIASSGTESMRRVVGDFFFAWFRRLDIEQLDDQGTVERVISLTETSPDRYLPLLARMAERDMQGTSTKTGNWRREIVWLAERLSAFPEYFDSAERLLFCLARSEAEPSIANNATGVWSALFRITLSGTALPFSERLQRLRIRVAERNVGSIALVCRGLEAVFQDRTWRVVPPILVGGRVAPPEWRPRTWDEVEICLKDTLALVREATESGAAVGRAEILNTVVRNLRSLLAQRQLPNLTAIFAGDIPDDVRGGVVEQVNNFLAYDVSRFAGVTEEELRGWLRELTPQTLHGQLVAAVGRSPWGSQRSREQQMMELASLAAMMVGDLRTLEGELPWLLSPSAKSASQFGFELGKGDAGAELLRSVTEASVRSRSTALGRGYYGGLGGSFERHLPLMNEVLDEIQSRDPDVAFQLFTICGDATRAFARTLTLVRQARLPAHYLGAFAVGIGQRRLQPQELIDVLEALLAAAEEGSGAAYEAALEAAFLRLEDRRDAPAIPPEDAAAEPFLWQLIEIKPPPDGRGEPTFWAALLRALSRSDIGRAAEAAAKGLLDPGLRHEMEAMQVLAELSARDAEVVLEKIDSAISDSERGWMFQVGDYRPLVTAIPEEPFLVWLERKGVTRARAIARHLPRPFVASTGEAVVPQTTAWVLTRFADDDATFRAFCAGVHSYELFSGDIAAQHEEYVRVAERFLDHPIPRIREWAAREITEQMQEAKEWRRRSEEEKIPR